MKASVHFVGIGGAGMHALARFALAKGVTVSGSDQRPTPILDALSAAGATVFHDHAASHITPDIGQVVYSSAIPPDNVEVCAARARDIPLSSRGAYLAGWVNAHPQGIAVCGTHGKGTCAAALIAMLEAHGARVSFVLGAPRRSDHCAALALPEDDFLVAEVDESDRTHLCHHPSHLLINNIEADHLNVYPSLADIATSFEVLYQRWRARGRGHCVLGSDGEGMTLLLRRLSPLDPPTTLCRWDPHGDTDAAHLLDARDLNLEPDGSLTFTLTRDAAPLGRLHPALKGDLNARNLITAAAMALALGVPFATIQAAVATYDGLVDRFEERRLGPFLFVTDYTSHPTCIAGNLRALRARVPGRIHAVFQPFRYSLLAYHWDAFATALGAADLVHLAPLDAGGEATRPEISSTALAAAVCAAGGHAVAPYDDLSALAQGLQERLVAGDGVIVFGGGGLFTTAAAAVAARAAHCESA